MKPTHHRNQNTGKAMEFDETDASQKSKHREGGGVWWRVGVGFMQLLEILKLEAVRQRRVEQVARGSLTVAVRGRLLLGLRKRLEKRKKHFN